MPWQDIPGQKGVKWRPLEETLRDPEYNITYDTEGQPVAARQKAGWFTKSLPYLIGGGMMAPHIAAALGLGSAAGATTAASGAGALPTSASYTNLGIQAGMRGAPTAAMLTPAAAMGGGGGSGWLNRIGNVASNMVSGGGGLNPWQIAALAGLSGVPALLANRGPGEEEKAVYAQLLKDLEFDRQTRDMQRQRYQMQSPLFEAVTRLAMGRMPTDVQRPIQGV